eukprot:4177723-Prymnesium_polylepis.1
MPATRSSSRTDALLSPGHCATDCLDALLLGAVQLATARARQRARWAACAWRQAWRRDVAGPKDSSSAQMSSTAESSPRRAVQLAGVLVFLCSAMSIAV